MVKRRLVAMWLRARPYTIATVTILKDRATVAGLLSAGGTIVGRHFDPHHTDEIARFVNLLMWVALITMTRKTNRKP